MIRSTASPVTGSPDNCWKKTGSRAGSRSDAAGAQLAMPLFSTSEPAGAQEAE